MTLRKLWLLVLVSVAVITVGINAVILSVLTDRYFSDYMADSYNKHMLQILEYTEKAMMENNVSYNQMAIELQTHLFDPIIGIKVYDKEGIELVEVADDYYMSDFMMNGWMMSGMMTPEQDEADSFTIKNDGIILGYITITRYSSIENSIVSQMFKNTLLSNSLIAIAIAILIAVVIGVFISKKMSKELSLTAQMAQDIRLGINSRPGKTRIHEITVIRESLESLSSRLRLKQKSRKSLVDELVHQTRTPLTVLKTHLEAMEDGIIEMTSEEIEVCRSQIDNITTTMKKMNGLIDARKDNNEINIEIFDFNWLINQITAGLRAQYTKKGVSLDVSSGKKIQMKTDKYKLSQAIHNILTNAYKYTRPGGHVTIGYALYDNYLKIIIKDSGIGMDDSEIKNIFKAYYRADKNSDETGEGIGLFIAKENLNAINGDISAESVKGEGSIFIIKVPVVYNKH